MLPDRVFVLTPEIGNVGGAAKAALLLCEALAKGGSRVKCFASIASESEPIARLERKGIRVTLPILAVGHRFRAPQRSIAAQIWLAAKREKPDAIIAVGLTRELRQLLELPQVAPILAWETTEATPGNKFVDPRVPSLISRVDTILVPSAAVEQNVRSSYGSHVRTARLPFWVEEQPVQVQTVHTRTGRMLFVGRMDPDKGFKYLLPAFDRIKAKYSNAQLHICGGGTPSAVPELTHERQGVHVLGRVAAEVLEHELDACDWVVLPSLHEGYPLSLLEAAAHGKPVIATNVGSIPEVFGGRHCAILVNPRDEAALEIAMSDALSESSECYEVRCRDARDLFAERSSTTAVQNALSNALGAYAARTPLS